MHRLSDRVLGGLYIAIDCGLIKKANCSLNESDLGESFNIRVLRTGLNLGHGLLTPDGKAVVSIPVKRESKTVIFQLRGAGKANVKLPAVLYDTNIFKATYPNWAQWRDELLYRQRPDGTLHVEDFESYTRIQTDSTPPDWPQGLTRDRTLASEAHYRLKNLSTKTGLPKDGHATQSNSKSLRSNSSGTSGKVLSIAEIIDERYGFKDGNRKRAVVLTDSEDEIVTPATPKKKKKRNETMLSEMPNRQRSPSPAIPPIEVHKAAFQAAFRDKSVQRTELFHALLPHITVADAEEILSRCKRIAAVISESKFE
ncbi:hypothetical protein V500_05165 [Pseudogymnoascus sp. VKM F-4518 (FW-2643)]|nr:hypothetical protein V500_05165 [Pseudogymnoascus sp. VKM F-4518 (FW-2643)]